MRKIAQMVAALGLICLVSAASLTAVSIVTSPIIEIRRVERIRAMVRSVFPGAKFDFSAGAEADRFEAIDEEGGPAGVVYVVSAKGYSSKIVVMVGFRKDGRIVGVRICEQRETPGLGSKIVEPEFCRQFAGKNVMDLVQGDFKFDAVTGATVSSKAVYSAVSDAVARFTDEPFFAAEDDEL